MENERLKWFNRALNEKMPGTTVEDLSVSLRIEPSVFIEHIVNGREFDSMAGSVIQSLLGGTLSDFVDSGRDEAGGAGALAGASAASGPAAESRALLDKAARIFDAGGPQAEALATIIKLMEVS
ncbi:hypothetical protein LJB99_05655 [Deltaproteobacteria bacterium OttesenSCG-928-K17]|nr:hypothetical protein [Deltaproteobacteria bacterium OttesenSCG-928-K17]